MGWNIFYGEFVKKFFLLSPTSIRGRLLLNISSSFASYLMNQLQIYIIYCERAKDVWAQSYKKIQKLSLPPSSFLDIWSYLSTILDKSDLQGTSYIAKMLWTRRNEWVHQDKFLHPNLILSKALEEYISFLMAQTHSDLLLTNLWELTITFGLNLSLDGTSR